MHTLSIEHRDKILFAQTMLNAVSDLLNPAKQQLDSENRDNLACLLGHFTQRSTEPLSDTEAVINTSCLGAICDLITPSDTLDDINRANFSTLLAYLLQHLDGVLKGNDHE